MNKLEKSILNTIKELEGFLIIYNSVDDGVEKDEVVEEAINEIMFNLQLCLDDGVEYVSDEYRFVARRRKECV